MSADFRETLFEEAEEAEERPPAREYGKSVVIAVVGAAYLVAFGFGVFVVVGDLLSWAGDNVHFLGDTTPSTGRENLRDDVLALTRQVACIAAIGVVLGLWWRRRLAVGLFGIGALVALVAGLTVYAIAAEDEPDRPAWQDRPHVCQEYSGDGNRCPGG
jgi:hypothetical protein